MVTVSHLVKKIVDSRPALQDSLIEDIVNYSSLAARLQSGIEAELGHSVKRSAILMALHRHAEGLREKSNPKEGFAINPEIVMKTDLCDLCIVKTPSAYDRITEIYRLVDLERGETLNVIQGNYEITIVATQRHLDEIHNLLDGEKVLNVETDLVSLTLSLSPDFLHTSGVMSLITRKLSWEDINIFEVISTMTELIFIISEKDAVKAYNTFKEIIREYSV
jgi:aspartokinase